MNKLTVMAGCLLPIVALSNQAEIEKWDPNMALTRAVVDTNGVKWIDGRYLPIEGRAFDDVDDWYDRLPSGVTTNVNGGVRSMKHHTSGMMFRFSTDSRTLRFRWKPYQNGLAMDHMPATGVSGIDVYRFDAQRGRWLYPDKPIMVSESGCGGLYGMHDPNASINTEEYQEEYLRDILECLWANPDCSGFAIWQMNDGRTRERFCERSCSAMFGGSIAGCFDQLRRPKKSVETVKSFFRTK